MLYALIGEDAPGTLDTRMAVRPGHVARLQALQADGRLILAGPARPWIRPIRAPPASAAA